MANMKIDEADIALASTVKHKKLCSICFTIIQKTARSHKKSSKCETCRKGCSNNSTLSKIEKVPTEKKTFVCKFCEKTFSSKASLVGHEKTHDHVEEDFVCPICGKCCDSAGGLNRHEGIHKEEKVPKSISCQFCVKKFDSFMVFQSHLKSHPTVTLKTKCKFCDKYFQNNSALIIHEKTHTGEKPSICRFCYKAFSDAPTLLEHEKSHTEKLKCLHCDISFDTRELFMKHNTSKIHATLDLSDLKSIRRKPKIKSFGQPDHTRPTACTNKLLMQRFEDKDSISKSSFSEYPFLCHLCGQRFINILLLQNHHKTHKFVKKFECLQCNISFESLSLLMKHNTSKLHATMDLHSIIGSTSTPVENMNVVDRKAMNQNRDDIQEHTSVEYNNDVVKQEESIVKMEQTYATEVEHVECDRNEELVDSGHIKTNKQEESGVKMEQTYATEVEHVECDKNEENVNNRHIKTSEQSIDRQVKSNEGERYTDSIKVENDNFINSYLQQENSESEQMVVVKQENLDNNSLNIDIKNELDDPEYLNVDVK